MKTELVANTELAAMSHADRATSTAFPVLDEHRQHARRSYSGRVSCVGDPECEFAALNLSAGGVGLLSSRPFTPGQPVTLGFLSGNMLVEGVVCRVQPVYGCDWEVGISFVKEEHELLDVVRSIG